jgi:hypothetical protein
MKKQSELSLSQSTIEKLGYYVYILIDPRDNNPFYVGKGCGNRINHHFLGALDINTKETKKINRIREIEKNGLQVGQIILRHQLLEKEAFEVESAIIDLLGKNHLTNLVLGHYSDDRGIMTIEDLKIKYEALPAIIDDPVLLININKLYNREMTATELYEATRKYWKINVNRASKSAFICSVFRGIIREVYSLDEWLPSKQESGRYIFYGKVAQSSKRDKYLHKSVTQYWRQGSQNPIKYVNC